MKYKIPISVVMPCYNREAYVAEAIESILAQTYNFFEFIIVNDGSTDNTELEIKKYKDPRIKYIKCSINKGNYVARNIGMKAAEGKYICVMDSDDISLPNRLELQYNFLETHLNVGCLGGAFEIMVQKNKEKKIIKYPLTYKDIKSWLLKSCFIRHPTAMFRTHLLKKHNLYYNENYRYASDYGFFVKAAQLFPVRNLEEVILKYRSHSNQISTDKSVEQVKIADIFRKDQLTQFKLNPTTKEIDLHLRLIKEKYLNDNDLDLCEDWCNKLLETNKKLKLFNNKSLYNLLKYSLQMAIRNNSLGTWSIEKDMLSFIDKTISKGESILEFGSGLGTEALLEKYKVTSIEHDENFNINRGENHDIILAPIEKNWYTKHSVKKALNIDYDLIIVDGPPGNLRAGILQNIDLFKSIKTPIIFDDIDREIDKETMESFCNKLNYNYKIITGNKKKFAYCTKIGTSKK
ncbi:hypothetical protein BW723_08425 [Polaribacter reichenbachii]|uniref:Glycosyltransferase 2-like domain-containing protein n=1 Tax=Polaribacter reichenbachii TaxID=996801 RepID=A0A1B8U6W1_9FLAO|nr:glycosyltransferase family 2 protein [Polaribacter reichenbachii]APZ46320.1 hypothetical protein BW723_08425 [Polaribacter reichenbachii]AUC20183.1 hypothetical protein BTO17_16445 [Polaribacter reichenbachii]OBY67558.1 hypothetical protein LPB301_01065 [Polaribacter reichenbachii]